MEETQTDNWDFENGYAIPKELWLTTNGFWEMVQSVNTDIPEPFVSPCGDGTVFLSWVVDDDRKFVVEIDNDKWWVSRRDSEGYYWKAMYSDSTDVLQKLVEFFNGSAAAT